MIVGDRVRVTISKVAARDDYAQGCAAALNGRLGTISERNPSSTNGRPFNCPAFLVRFDEPAPTWNTMQRGPVNQFWFPPCDLRPT